MSSYPKIPIPFKQRLEEFRHSYMPILAFAGVLIFTVNLWNRHVAPPSIVGSVEAVRANITATAPGELVEMKVDLMMQVEKGDPIAVISIMDDEAVRAEARAEEADLLVFEERLRLNNTRVLEAYESLKHNLAVRRVDRATEQANLTRAENDYRRMAELVKLKTVSEAEYDLAKATRDSLKEKIAALDELIKEMEESLRKLKPPSDLLTPNTTSDPIAQAIKTRHDALVAAAKPMVVKAPMSGIVSAVYKRAGEKVVRGDAIVVISSTTSERIVGFVRQPLNVKPKIGDMVDVRARSFGRSLTQARVIKVGTQLELIDPSVLPMAVQNGTIEYGLPLLIELPKGLNLMPGETVDISMASANRQQ